MGLKEKIEIYKNMNYTQFFNVKARGFNRGDDILQEYKDYCVFDLQESLDYKKQLLERVNRYSDNNNVLYIHIPFCVSRCNYCPFYISAYNKELTEQYVDALIKEVEYISSTEYAKTTEFEALYIGGGTPSSLSEEQIKRLLNKLFSLFHFKKNGQFTFESNAATLTESKLKLLKKCGINRVSLGVQSLDNQILKEMNCAHNREEVLHVVKLLQEYGFIINVDLIFGLLNQTEEHVKKDLEFISNAQLIDHISYFPLRIVERTKLENLLYEDGVVERQMDKLLTWDTMIEAELNRQGYEREFCTVQYHKKNEEGHLYVSTTSRVLGLGVGAGTLFDHGELYNHDDVIKYIESVNKGEIGLQGAAPLSEEQMYERFILYSIIYNNRSISDFEEQVEENFRNYYGIEIEDRFHKVIVDMKRIKFIRIEDGKIVLTKRMYHILSQVRIGMPSII